MNPHRLHAPSFLLVIIQPRTTLDTHHQGYLTSLLNSRLLGLNAITMHKFTLTICSLLTAVVAKQCVNITIPVDVSARNGLFNVQTPESNLDVTQFSLNLTNAKGNFTDLSLLGYATVTGKAFISAKYCAPNTMPSQPIVQLLTHGIGFDKT